MIRRADQDALQEAAALLRQGRLVAFPTETVYGLGARADDDAAVRAIYEAKGRPANNPTIAHVADAEAAFALGAQVGEAARRLASRFWPGPLTLVLRANEGLTSALARAGGDTIAVRVPRHPVARALLQVVALPIAAPSANRSNAISPTTAAHVEKSLGTQLFILDGGATEEGLESTIVDVTGSDAVLLRRGTITLAQLREVVPIADAGGRVVADGEIARAPGGLARHYAPRVPLRCFDAPAAIEPDAGALLFEDSALVSAGEVRRLPRDPAGYAAGLYAALHALEDTPGVERILVEAPPREAAWAAVWDRLERAAKA